MADQTAKAQGADDPSMEEILQSIKKIIADDDKGAPAATAAPKTNGVESPPGSDVLELTEMVKEDTIENTKPQEASAPAASNDVLSKIDEALAVEPAKPAAPAPIMAQPSPATIPDNTLLSDQAALAAASSFKKLQVEEPLPPLNTTPSPMLASGNTVEAMVMQMLKPMLKEWLDANLPAIVERIVTVEIRKLTK